MTLTIQFADTYNCWILMCIHIKVKHSYSNRPICEFMITENTK